MEINSITKRLLFSTVRVDTVLEDGSEGTGTAFVLSHVHNGQRHHFVVTNRHLAEDVRSGALIFTRSARGKPNIGRGFCLDIDDFSHAWFYHPDPEVDLAVLPLAPLEAHIRSLGDAIYYHAIASELIPGADILQALDALEEVMFLGYPSGIWDKANLMPILRRGTTATPILLDFEARKEFLIDAAVYPGSSGSPVFLYERDAVLPRNRNEPHRGDPLLFLGVVSAVFFKEEASQFVSVPVPPTPGAAGYCSEMIDLGLVIKSAAVREVVEAYLREARL